MGTPEADASAPLHTPGERAAWAMLCGSWRVIRFPIVALMIILEPLVRVLLASFALLLTLTAFFLKLVIPPDAHAPVLGLLALAVGCIALLTAYYLVLRFFSG